MLKVRIERKNILFAEIYDFGRIAEKKTTFFSDKESPLQFGILAYDEGHKIQRHKHKKLQRLNTEFSEATFVLEGEEIVNIYDEEDVFIGSHQISKNHLLVVYRGYHSMEVLTNFRALEFKLGPFIANDKEFAS